MNAISRRNVVRSASVLFAMPFTEALLPAYASEQTGSQSAPPIDNRFKLTSAAATAVSPDLVNFVKDHSAKAVAANHLGTVGDYSALGSQFHMLGKHLALAGADKLVKAHCKKLLKSGEVPTVDPQAVAHAVSCVQAYAPSYSAGELLSSSAVPATPQEWRVQLKKLKKHGLVKYFHQAGRQLNAMGQASHNRPGGSSKTGIPGPYKTAAYDPTDSTQSAHLMDICSLSQKAKFWACIGAAVAAGALVLAGIVAICGATGLVACIGAAFPSATVGVAVFFAGLGLVTGALIAACAVFLASYHEKSRPSAVLSAI